MIGEYCAISMAVKQPCLGESGEGKSTLLHLLEVFLEGRGGVGF